MIQTVDLVKTFGSFKALDGLSMHVAKGSVYGLVGPNGAGKSTVIRHITGIYKQDSGVVLIDNEPVWENVAAKQKIAYIAPIRKLSKGMQKQSAFWLSMCMSPEVLVLDEPVDGLDPVMRRQIWSIIMMDVAERNTTVLVSSHNLRELEDVCDHVGIMSNGKILLERSLVELQENICKIQIAFDADTPQWPAQLNVLHESSLGRITTLIVKDSPTFAIRQLEPLNPLLIEPLPLTLEEIFIYELGGTGYECKDILF